MGSLVIIAFYILLAAWVLPSGRSWALMRRIRTYVRTYYPLSAMSVNKVEELANEIYPIVCFICQEYDCSVEYALSIYPSFIEEELEKEIFLKNASLLIKYNR